MVDVAHLVVKINENINPKCTKWTTVKVCGPFLVIEMKSRPDIPVLAILLGSVGHKMTKAIADSREFSYLSFSSCLCSCQSSVVIIRKKTV